MKCSVCRCFHVGILVTSCQGDIAGEGREIFPVPSTVDSSDEINFFHQVPSLHSNQTCTVIDFECLHYYDLLRVPQEDPKVDAVPRHRSPCQYSSRCPKKGEEID